MKPTKTIPGGVEWFCGSLSFRRCVLDRDPWGNRVAAEAGHKRSGETATADTIAMGFAVNLHWIGVGVRPHSRGPRRKRYRRVMNLLLLSLSFLLLFGGRRFYFGGPRHRPEEGSDLVFGHLSHHLFLRCDFVQN